MLFIKASGKTISDMVEVHKYGPKAQNLLAISLTTKLVAEDDLLARKELFMKEIGKMTKLMVPGSL